MADRQVYGRWRLEIVSGPHVTRKIRLTFAPRAACSGLIWLLYDVEDIADSPLVLSGTVELVHGFLGWLLHFEGNLVKMVLLDDLTFKGFAVISRSEQFPEWHNRFNLALGVDCFAHNLPQAREVYSSAKFGDLWLRSRLLLAGL